MRLSALRLLEFSPSRTVFNHILNDTTIHMGFECEFVSDKEPQEVYNNEPDFSQWDWSDVENNCNISSRQQRRINAAFQEWRSEQADKALRDLWDRKGEDYTKDWLRDNDYINDENEDEVDEDDLVREHEDEAREAFNEEYRDDVEDDAGDMDDFISDQYGSTDRFMYEFDIEYYGDEDREEEVTSETVNREIADDLESWTGYPAYSDGSSGMDYWTVQDDVSIDGGGYIGVEIASPVFAPISAGLNMMQRIFKWMRRNSYDTNDSTGLHVSFSIAGKSEADYDFLKMMVLFDENYTAELFDRLGNGFAQQMREVLASNFSQSADPISTMSSRQIDETISALRQFTANMRFGKDRIGVSKYFSFRHRAKGVVEFRGMGGDSYENKFDVIRNRVVNMAFLMKVGSDPTLMARQYLTRVYRMLTSAKYSEPELGSGMGRVDTPPMLSGFAQVFSTEPRMAKVAQTNPGMFLSRIAGMLYTGSHLDPLQLRQLRFYIARNKLTAEALRAEFQDDTLYNALAHVMRWPMVVPGQHDPRQQTLPFAHSGNDQSGNPPQPVQQREVPDRRQQRMHLSRW
jgi:hypothetical protein